LPLSSLKTFTGISTVALAVSIVIFSTFVDSLVAIEEGIKISIGLDVSS